MTIAITALMIAVLVALVIVLIKFLLCNCVILRRSDDSVPILPSRREAFWIEYDRLRLQALQYRQPPPDFDDALRNSRPVSYIDIEDQPPPTYEDFLKSQTPSPVDLSPLNMDIDDNVQEVSHVGLSPFDDDFIQPHEHLDLGESSTSLRLVLALSHPHETQQIIQSNTSSNGEEMQSSEA